jgi:hypothetical protein
MIHLTSEMKNMAISYRDHLQQENPLLEGIDKQQDAGLKKVKKAGEDLDEFNANSITCWRLILMFAISGALFLFTTFFIVFDRMII